MARVNQLEIKDTCFKFAINNVSRQGDNKKIKLNLEVEETFKDFTPNFLWNKWQRAKFLISLTRDTIKHIILSVLQKQSTAEYSQLHLQKAPF